MRNVLYKMYSTDLKKQKKKKERKEERKKSETRFRAGRRIRRGGASVGESEKKGGDRGNVGA